VNNQPTKFAPRNKIIKKVAKRALALLIIAYIYWPIALLYVITGVYDVARQKSQDKKFLFYQYFLVNGTLAWLFSPLNTLVDILCLPFINKQVYKLSDLPPGHIDEINQIINECPRNFLVSTIRDLALKDGRSMLMYKWYGFNVENEYTVPLFHRDFKKILTIGVSSFKANTSTRKHFGWLRAGIRVLINIDEQVDEGAYIVVNDQAHVWKNDGPLYIFDDTVMHISYNQTNSTRNCLFIDIVRPSYLEFILVRLVKFLGILSKLPIVARFSEWKIIR